MTPEEEARVKIDKQLMCSGWDVVSRGFNIPGATCAIREALMQGKKESDYLLFVDHKAIAVVEAKREENSLGDKVITQAENYARTPLKNYGLWCINKNTGKGFIPLVYLANGDKIYFKNLIKNPDGKYVEIKKMHTPKQMLEYISGSSVYGCLPRLESSGLRKCQYDAELNLEQNFKDGKKRSLAVLATGSGKTYLACMASYRVLNYTQLNYSVSSEQPKKRILFLADRNNLARQAENEFCNFKRTERDEALKDLYEIKRLRKPDDTQAEIVISTIQKLYSVMTGKNISDDDEDKEDEENAANEDFGAGTPIKLGDDLKVGNNHFQFIIVDECHRSIYGKWKPILEYFKGAHILGLTATPTPEAEAFFNKNIIAKYTYESSVNDGVNVPKIIYRIKTKTTEIGNIIESGTEIEETTKQSGVITTKIIDEPYGYSEKELDRSIIDVNQIETIISEYREILYTKLYPERHKENGQEDWLYVPKTLIFAKRDKHADEIVKIVKKVFGEQFNDGSVPDNFVKKITCTAGDSNQLISEFRTSKEFRIAVTVTLVATGTDIPALDVVLFMSDVKSAVLYTQMSGRACRTIGDDKYREITPNAMSKDLFYLVDAVGVTESEKGFVQSFDEATTKLSLKDLLERLSLNDLSDDNLIALRDYCASINRRYTQNKIFSVHLREFIDEFDFSPASLAEKITCAMDNNELPEFISASYDNTARRVLIEKLMNNVEARHKLLELNTGYVIRNESSPDELLYSGFSVEEAKSFIETFEEYINNNKDKIEALRIIYNDEEKLITHSMLIDLRNKFLQENKMYRPSNIWDYYRILDMDSPEELPTVDELDVKGNVNALTNLIQIVRYAFGKSTRLVNLSSLYVQRFNLYCGQKQRELKPIQANIMREIAEYVASDGAFKSKDLNAFDKNLWNRGIKCFGSAKAFDEEIESLSNFILRAA